MNQFQWPKKLVLGSSSSKRRELMIQEGYFFDEETPNIDETNHQLEKQSFEDLVQWLAWQKAKKVALDRNNFNKEEATVISADTFCVFNNEMLGKPSDSCKAKEMLLKISKSTHCVMTGVCILNQINNDSIVFMDRSLVTFNEISTEAINKYIKTNIWKNKAGGYDYMDRYNAGWPISCVGDISTVQGLPMLRIKKILSFLNFFPTTK